ncbi:MAG TPA: hypothetical protein VF129_04570 [Actinomycetota bacterium]
MRFRLGLVVGGVIGYLIARELSKHEGNGPNGIRAAMSRHPSSQRLAGLAGRAGSKGVEAIQRARATIQRRLVADVDDLSMN